MALFCLIGRDGEQGGERRQKHRDAHLANLEPLARDGRVRFGGPLRDAAGQPVGSVVIFEAKNLAAAHDFAETDPYVTEGVFESWEVFETTAVFPRED